MNLFETIAGRNFLESVEKSLRKIASELARANNLKEKEVELLEKTDRSNLSTG